MKIKCLKEALKDVPEDMDVVLLWPADHDPKGETIDSEHAEFAAINSAGKFIIGTTRKG